MGFSSTFVTDVGNDGTNPLPEWFIKKWQDSVNFCDGNRFPLSSKTWARAHAYWRALEDDIQKACTWRDGNFLDNIIMVYLHECGGITRVEIKKDLIRYHDPAGWRKTHSNMAHDVGDRCHKDIENAQDELAETPAF